MAIVKVCELSGKALDYAVAMCEGHSPVFNMNSHGCTWRGWWLSGCGEYVQLPKYSTDWAIAGPIIDKCGIEINSRLKRACMPEQCLITGKDFDDFVFVAETVLIAAMRCYVASTMGESVEIPDNLL